MSVAMGVYVHMAGHLTHTQYITALDDELKALERSRTLAQIFFNYWARHKCPNHDMCMRVLILDGQLKASHTICGLLRAVLGGEKIELAELEKPIYIGCKEACARGSRFCSEHGPLLEFREAAVEKPAAEGAKGGGRGGGGKAKKPKSASRKVSSGCGRDGCWRSESTSLLTHVHIHTAHSTTPAPTAGALPLQRLRHVGRAPPEQVRRLHPREAGD